MKYFLAIAIFTFAGGLFFWQLNVTKSATTPEENVQRGSPFGEGSLAVGALEDDEEGDEDEVEGGEDMDTPPVIREAQTSMMVVTRGALQTHNKAADCWVAYKNVVYDITAWLPRHPGSAGAIAPYCGTAEEFATAFTSQHGTGKEGRLKTEGVVEGKLAN